MTTAFRYLLTLCVVAAFTSGCSSSSDTQSPVAESVNPISSIDTAGTVLNQSTSNVETVDIVSNDPANGNSSQILAESPNEPSTEIVESSNQNLTRVTFDITVPAYVSDSLQVRLVWGDLDTTAMWVVDESWTVIGDLPTDTLNPLIVTFNDNNGAITLGNFETDFSTGVNSSETVQIKADQFDTNQWDSDNDGQSNLSELIAGTNPQGDDLSVPEPVQANLELVPDKTFRITWQPSADATRYRILENPDGLSGFTQISDDLNLSTQLFDHRVALYKRTNAQYIVQACNSSGCSDSSQLTITGTLEQGIGYFKSPNAKGGTVDSSQGRPLTIGADHFGGSVSLSADGNTLVAAATQEDSAATGVNGLQNDNSAINAGAVYVYTREDDQWQFEAYIKASNTQEVDLFGFDLALSADGNTLAVGVPFESSADGGINGDQADNSAFASGAVYLFVRSNGSWRQQSYIKASNAQTEDQFGYSVDLSGDGNTLVVGARFEDGTGSYVNSEKDDDGKGNGAAYVFTRSGETWIEQSYLKPSNSDNNDNFGSVVRISSDGRTVAIAAPGEGSFAVGINGDENDNSSFSVGAVYVFVRTDETWVQEAYIKGSAFRRQYNFSQHAMDLNEDGSTLAVGVWTDDNLSSGLDSAQTGGGISSSGTVYLFTRNNGGWQQQAFLKASNPRSTGLFGRSVSLSDDGNTLAVGSNGESSASIGVNGDQNDILSIYVGAVYVFERSNDNWQQQAYVKASNTEANDGFSVSISLSGDGNSLAVAAPSERGGSTGINGDQSDNSAPGSGAVYLY